ncbi:hypothetical protein ATO49_20695 [Mycolicibacterium fortuitum subsp. fortuitum DSM 46621 = ATCC 6841 = JCM 6387]|nr:hypothetical protein ATO49_20695 [Mycolicibacterium fortuitum subsp. fortuitum DSM 46621 = ATCC 6841 = JCM 6387]
MQGGSVHRTTAGFIGQQERRAELRGHRTGGQHARNILGADQSARSGNRYVHGRQHIGQQVVQRLRCGRGARIERATVSPGPRTLDGESVDAPAHRQPGFVQSSHGADGGDPCAAQPGDLRLAGQAEGERDHLGP